MEYSLESGAHCFVKWLVYDFGKAAVASTVGDAVLYCKLECVELRMAQKVDTG